MAESGAGATATYEMGQLYRLPIGDIQPDPNQPRKYFDEEGLAELAQSIADKGVLQPVLVRLDEDGDVALVAGERRLKAAQQSELRSNSQSVPIYPRLGEPAPVFKANLI